MNQKGYKNKEGEHSYIIKANSYQRKLETFEFVWMKDFYSEFFAAIDDPIILFIELHGATSGKNEKRRPIGIGKLRVNSDIDGKLVYGYHNVMLKSLPKHDKTDDYIGLSMLDPLIVKHSLHGEDAERP